MEKEIHTNPFTGIQYTREVTDYGVEATPAQHSFGWDGIGTTRTICLNNSPEGLAKSLQDLAIGLSDMTGHKIEFIYTDDKDCSIFGDFGKFIVRNPRLYEQHDQTPPDQAQVLPETEKDGKI
jgi:hypothetical protein